jgi:predicted secreted protein
MKWYSVLAISLLFWTFTLFLVLPYGNRTANHDERIPGQAESAPVNLSMRQKLLWTTIVSAALCGLFFANLHFGWITIDDIPGWRPEPMPPELRTGG